MVALLVALVSVLALSIPIIKDAFTPDNSAVKVRLQGLHQGDFYLIASNLGSRPGTVESARLTVAGLSSLPLRGEFEVINWYEGAGFIPAGSSKQVMLAPGRLVGLHPSMLGITEDDLRRLEQLSFEESFRLEGPARMGLTEDDFRRLVNKMSAAIEIEVVQFDGSTNIYRYELTSLEVADYLEGELFGLELDYGRLFDQETTGAQGAE